MEPRSNNVHQSTLPHLHAWRHLPWIVQHQILRELANDYNRHLPQHKRHRAAYAAVCLEWQAFFEASTANFGKLVLQESALDEFGRIIQRRHYKMPYLRHIWLRVVLQKYGCDHCQDPETEAEITSNNMIFTNALWKLLDILSTWEKRNIISLENQDLTLEFSAQSPSDSQHAFRQVLGLQKDYPYLDESSVQRQYMIQLRDNITTELFQRIESDVQSFIPVTVAMAARLIRPLDFNFSSVAFKQGQWKYRLPEAKMVTSFVIRRQYLRDISVSALARLYDESLPRLRTMRHERWRLPHEVCQQEFDWSYGPTQEFSSQNLGLASIPGHVSRLPSSLQSLHLFEDFSSTMHGAEPSSRPRPSRIQILKGLAAAAPSVKHLAVSFLSDAMECLDTPDNAWFPNLESIALTSQTHFRPKSPANLNDVLHKAALAASTMPKLQIMEIWNCENGYAAIFRYEAMGPATPSACRLTWGCSWHPAASMQSRVVKAWGNVASMMASRGLLVDNTQDPLPPGPYDLYGRILGQLKLRNRILDPISLMQARIGVEREGEVDIPMWKPTTPYVPTTTPSAAPA